MGCTYSHPEETDDPNIPVSIPLTLYQYHHFRAGQFFDREDISQCDLVLPFHTTFTEFRTFLTHDLAQEGQWLMVKIFYEKESYVLRDLDEEKWECAKGRARKGKRVGVTMKYVVRNGEPPEVSG